MKAGSLSKEAKNLHRLFDGISDASLLMKDGVYVACNQAAVDLLGYPNKESLLNLDRNKFYPPLQPDGADSFVKGLEVIELARQNGTHSCDWTYLKFDGTPIHTALMMAMSVVGGKEILHIVLRDLTERIEKQSDSVMQLLNKLGEASLIIKGHEYIDCNQAAADLLGYPDKKSLLNIHPIKISPEMQPDGQSSVKKANAIMDKGALTSSTYFEWTHLKRDGTPIVVDVMVTPVTINDEEMVHVIWRDLTEKKAMEAKVERLAYEDDLTGLANRRMLLERLSHVLSIYKRTNYKGALLFIDLDHFKTINDTLGHGIGDELLQQVARRLLACMRQGDTVSRFGGDEFVVMLEDLDTNNLSAANKAEFVCEKLLADLATPYDLNGKEVVVNASIGVTMFSKNHKPKDLFKQSDIAMYQAKAAGRNAIRFFDPEMQHAVDKRAEIEEQIKEGLSNDQFELHYQLQVDANGSALGVEALLRLNNPEKGYIPPMQYIPVAEETRLILHIGNWVLETACAQLKQWESDEKTQRLTIAVNVSAMEFKEHSFVNNVLIAIRHHEINASLLKLELTETMLVEDIDSIIAKMTQLKRAGVQFSLDDFGTGYSSLQYLKQLPLNQLKIDQSFVRDLEDDPQDRSIVQTIIVMAKGLELDVIAEGVENKQQLEMLSDFGCENYQGYFFAKPVPVDELERLLEEAK